MYLIICKCEDGSAWSYHDGEGFGITYFSTKEEADAVCSRLNELDLPWTHEVRERRESAA